jgi:branched-chain amino acid transport system substrate-binding protein
MMMKLPRQFWLLVSSVLVLAASSALAEKKYGPGATDTEIKIGQTFPYSGPLSAYSTMSRTEAAVFAKQNAEGGINGRKIVFISLDDSYSPPKTVEQTRRLVEQEQVLLLFNPLGTPTNMSIIKYVNQKHVPHLLLGTGASIFGDYRSYPWTLGLWPSYPTEARVFVQYIMKNLPQAKVGVLSPNLDSGRDFVKGVHEAFGAQTDKFIVKEVAYDDSQPTVDSEVISLQSAGANVFLAFAPPKAAAQAIRKAGALGWKPTIFVSSIAASIESVMKPAGIENSLGVISTAWFKDPTDPQWKNDPAMLEHFAFMKRYYPEGNPAEPYNVAGQIAAGALVQILKQCGDDLTRENVMRQAENLREFAHPLLLPGIKLTTGPADHYPVEQVQLQRFDGKEWVRFGDVLSGN